MSQVATVRRRSSRFAALVVGVAVVAAACGNSKTTGGTAAGPGQTDGVTAKEIDVGALVAKTGLLGNQYFPLTYGVQAYFNEINATGGVNGRLLKLTKVHDDATNPTRSTAQAKALVEVDKVFAVFASSPIFPAGTYLAQKAVPTFGTNFNAEWNSGPTLFGHNGSHNDYTGAFPFLPWLAKQIGTTTAASIAYTVASSADCSKGMVNSFNKFGIKVGLADQSLQFGASDVSGDIQRIKESGAGLVATCMDPSGNTLIAKGLRQAGLTNVKMAWPNGYDNETLASYKDLMEGVYFGLQHVPFESADQVPEMKHFLDAMKRDYPNEPLRETMLFGWINAKLFVQGLKAAGKDVTRKKVVDAINKITNFSADGLIPPIDWTKQHTGNGPYDCNAVVQVQHGKFVPVFGTGGTPFVCFNSPNATTTDTVPVPKFS
ncbi:MAG: ABC-type branched-chain amino acid transport system periplasmic component-like protein [Acidimicrobiales bacterium]|jgi:ABC-type branched-subunit amino acid transport system substrate-binding protein|nr:ABC-type branched-chain amino acid transport system periplasmic component-like protein [Acidimicrobiales bacterium]